MGRITIILLASVMMTFIFRESSSQVFTQDRKLSKKERQEARKAQLFQNYKAIETLIQHKQFVLEADFLQGKNGDQIPVTSMINFVMVDTPLVVIQTGSNPSVGYNGLGGVTAEGSLSKWEVNSDPDKLTHTVFLTTMTNLGSYDVLIRISPDATATAAITGTRSGRLTYRGKLVATFNSKVYKGQRTL